MSPAGQVAWRTVLDQFESELDELERALDAGSAESDVFAAYGTSFDPPPIAPLPAELRARAEVVQRRMAAVEQRIELSLRGARRALVIASRLTTRPPHPARFVDTRA